MKKGDDYNNIEILSITDNNLAFSLFKQEVNRILSKNNPDDLKFGKEIESENLKTENYADDSRTRNTREESDLNINESKSEEDYSNVIESSVFNMPKKNFILLSVAIGLGVGIATFMYNQQEKDFLKTPETEIEKVSYSFGLGYAFSLKNQGMDTIIDLDLFCKAFRDIFQNDSLDISKEEGEKILDEYFAKIQQEIMDKQLSENRKLIEESNGGEIILASGLKIIIIEDKDGLSPQLSDTVTAEMQIGLLSDSILQKLPEPQTFPISQVFPGLTEGIQLMSIGDKWKITIPPELAAGNGETMIFEIELLGIN